MLKSRLKRFSKPKTNEKTIEVINSSGLFDEKFYLSVYGSIKPYSSAVEHYVAVGASLHYDPSPFFSNSYYLSMYEDVKTSSINPLFHYIKHGEEEGRVANAWFDAQQYLKLNPDLSKWGKTLLAHYQLLGKKEGRDI